jgi:hypothetical protein
VKESQIYREQLDTLSSQIKAEFEKMSEEILYRRPAPSANNAGFLYWHILRIWDLDLNHIIRGQSPSEDLWHRAGYSEKSGYNPDGKGLERLAGMGLGYSDAEVDEVNVPLDILYAYHDELTAETSEYLDSAGNDDLRAELNRPGRPPMTAAQRMQHLIGHSYGHLGDIRFAKGLLGHTDTTYPKSEAVQATS